MKLNETSGEHVGNFEGTWGAFGVYILGSGWVENKSEGSPIQPTRTHRCWMAGENFWVAYFSE